MRMTQYLSRGAWLPALAAFIGSLAGLAGAARAQPGDYANYENVVGTTVLGDSLYAVVPPGEPTRLMIVQRNGIIRVVENGTLLPNAFLSLGSTTAGTTGALNRITPNSGTVNISGTNYTIQRYSEQGLLGLAFDPNYASNRRFYIYYTAPRGAYAATSQTTASDISRTVLARYTTSAGNANLANTTEEVLITYPQPYVNHNGGCMQIGPDNFLYFTSGDGGSGNNPINSALDLRRQIAGADNVNSWLGKLHRIDIATATGYAVPPSNPFVGQTQLGESDRPEIFAYGLRNPWRFSFDRLNGDLWIGDVGQDVWEEVDYAPAPTLGAGNNYGWRVREGPVATGLTATPFSAAGAVEPVYTYPHSTMLPAYPSTLTGFSITGGYKYRGYKIPAWRDRYFFSDYVTARIWSFRYINGARVDFQDHTAALTGPTPAIAQVASFAEDANGELLVVQLNGRLRRIIPQALPAGVNPCDIAQDDGNPGSNGSVNEGDYNCFFNSFFQADYVNQWPADIANDAGFVAAQYAVNGAPDGGPNGRVNEGDYNAYFNNFFN
ncbi:hypothetical protein BH11PLA1_BH11PLA1_20420 [soil metagenome]